MTLQRPAPLRATRPRRFSVGTTATKTLKTTTTPRSSATPQPSPITRETGRTGLACTARVGANGQTRTLKVMVESTTPASSSDLATASSTRTTLPCGSSRRSGMRRTTTSRPTSLGSPRSNSGRTRTHRVATRRPAHSGSTSFSTQETPRAWTPKRANRSTSSCRCAPKRATCCTRKCTASIPPSMALQQPTAHCAAVGCTGATVARSRTMPTMPTMPTMHPWPCRSDPTACPSTTATAGSCQEASWRSPWGNTTSRSRWRASSRCTTTRRGRGSVLTCHRLPRWWRWSSSSTTSGPSRMTRRTGSSATPLRLKPANFPGSSTSTACAGNAAWSTFSSPFNSMPRRSGHRTWRH